MKKMQWLFVGGGFHHNGGFHCVDGAGLGFGVPVPAGGLTGVGGVGGVGVVGVVGVILGGTGDDCAVFDGTATVFGGAERVGGGVGLAGELTTGFGFVARVGLGFAVNVGVGAGDLGVRFGVGRNVVLGAGNNEGAATSGDRVGVTARGCGVSCGVGEAELEDAAAGGTPGSARAELRLPPKPDQLIANAVNATTTTANATSPIVDRRGQ